MRCGGFLLYGHPPSTPLSSAESQVTYSNVASERARARHPEPPRRVARVAFVPPAASPRRKFARVYVYSFNYPLPRHPTPRVCLASALISFPTFHDFLVAFRHAPASSSPRFSLALPLSLSFSLLRSPSPPPYSLLPSLFSLSFSFSHTQTFFLPVSRSSPISGNKRFHFFFIAGLRSRQRAQVLGSLCRNIYRKVLVMYSR